MDALHTILVLVIFFVALGAWALLDRAENTIKSLKEQCDIMEEGFSISERRIEEFKTEVDLLEEHRDYFEQRYVKELRENIELNRLVFEYARTIRELEEKNRELSIKLRSMPKSQYGKSEFSKSDLKLLRYYIHPDKHNGKTNDLYVMINKLYENS